MGFLKKFFHKLTATSYIESMESMTPAQLVENLLPESYFLTKGVEEAALEIAYAARRHLAILAFESAPDTLRALLRGLQHKNALVREASGECLCYWFSGRSDVKAVMNRHLDDHDEAVAKRARMYLEVYCKETGSADPG